MIVVCSLLLTVVEEKIVNVVVEENNMEFPAFEWIRISRK